MISQAETWFDGNLPSGWDTTSLRAAFHEKTEKSGEALDNYLSLTANAGVIPYAEKGDVGNKAPEDMSKCKKVSPGDFVLNSMNFGIGSFGVSKYEGVCSSVYLVLQPQGDSFNRTYLERIFELSSFQKHAQSLGNGILAHRAAFGWDKLRTIQVPVPPRAEQDSIVAFLDRELSDIDALLSANVKLLESLGLRRGALIASLIQDKAEALAKGIEGGIHSSSDKKNWPQVPLKYEICLNPEVLSEGTDPNEKFSYIEIGDVTFAQGITGHTNVKFAEAPSRARRVLKDGDILISTVRTYLKAIGQVQESLFDEHKVVASTGFAVLRTISMEPRFLRYAVSSDMFIQKIQAYSTGISYPAINASELVKFKVPVPPLQVQVEIADTLDIQLSKLTELQLRTSKIIDKLLERRSAVVSAAVTGKIDVRGTK